MRTAVSEPEKISPWSTIWLHPKLTMRHILDNFPTRYNHLLVIGGAFTHVIAYSISWYSWWLTVVVWVCLSIFSGLFTLYIGGGLLKWTGSWLKGQGSYQDVRSAIAWSQIPVLAFFIVEVIILLIVGGDGGNLFYTSVLFLLSLWTAIVFLCCLAEAQKFSFLKALISSIITGVIIVAAIVILMLLISAFSPDVAAPGGAVQTTEQT
ncbi:MAG: hypothetical protein S4CHLAM6_16270 [Chlamydiae bacterium]|nr:hypothetical protein [Chlamydiota bacterium]